MAKNEYTGKGVGKIASSALRTGRATPAEIKKIAASALTQRPDKGGKSGKR